MNSTWTKIDREDSTTWPSNGQKVTYFMILFKKEYEGNFYLEKLKYRMYGTFHSKRGKCDWYDVQYWKPRD